MRQINKFGDKFLASQHKIMNLCYGYSFSLCSVNHKCRNLYILAVPWDWYGGLKRKTLGQMWPPHQHISPTPPSAQKETLTTNLPNHRQQLSPGQIAAEYKKKINKGGSSSRSSQPNRATICGGAGEGWSRRSSRTWTRTRTGARTGERVYFSATWHVFSIVSEVNVPPDKNLNFIWMCISLSLSLPLALSLESTLGQFQL